MLLYESRISLSLCDHIGISNVIYDFAFVIVLISIINLVINFDENQYNTKTDTRQKIKS